MSRASAERIPAEAFHPGEFIADEIAARGWTYEDVAARMSDTTHKGLIINPGNEETATSARRARAAGIEVIEVAPKTMRRPAETA